MIILMSGDISDQYIGCYRHDREHNVMGYVPLSVEKQSQVTLQLCKSECHQLAKTYFGVSVSAFFCD